MKCESPPFVQFDNLERWPQPFVLSLTLEISGDETRCLTHVSPHACLASTILIVRLSGGAYYCPASRTLLVANLENGVDQYLFPQLERIKTFDWQLLECIVLHLTTVGEGCYILTGGDNGFARLYGPNDRDIMMLHHEGVDRVQAVAVRPSRRHV